MAALLIDEDWKRLAACVGHARDADGHDLFFPSSDDGEGGRPTQLLERQAKSVCAQCPVSQDCLDYAIRYDIEHGVWGGLNERERIRYREGKPVSFDRQLEILWS